jgi:hypothetical protein
MSILRVDQIQHSNGTSALTIDSSGRMNFGNKPLVHACRNVTSAWENFGTTAVIYIYNFTITNVGNNYSTSTGIFTCPISGYYKITTSALFGSVAAYAYQFHYKNGAPIAGNTSAHYNTTTSTGAYWTCGYSTIVQCSANDTLAVYATTSGTTIYGSGHSNLTIEFLG